MAAVSELSAWRIYADTMRIFLSSSLVLGTFLLVCATPGEGQQVLDYEQARAAVRRGEILPLEQILKIANAEYPGELVEIELEFDDGLWLYEVELVTDDGRLVEIELDARTGEIIDIDED